MGPSITLSGNLDSGAEPDPLHRADFDFSRLISITTTTAAGVVEEMIQISPAT
jgi:hypothetical protein